MGWSGRLLFGVAALCPAACTLSGLDGLTGGATTDAAPPVSTVGGRDAASGAPDAAASPFDTYRAAVLGDHPVAYYRLGETGPTAKDETGAHDGTYVGTPTRSPGAIAGDTNGAFHGDGTVWIDLGDPFPFTGNASYAIEAWVAPEAAPTLIAIVARNLASGGNPIDGYSLYLDPTLAPTMGRWTSSKEQSASSAVLPTGAYHYVVGTYDGATLRVYVDAGAPTTASAAQAIIAAQTHVTIGATRNGTYGFFRGSIDEVAIYDYALSATQITAHHIASGR